MVLGYISNESRRFHVFVANRVQEIQNSTSVEQWNHVESKQNPADEASRGVKSQELLHSRWINGPAFLWKTEDQWPINQDHSEGTFGLQNNDPEVKKHVTMATTEILKVDSEKTSLCERVKYFSDWYRAKRAIALCTPYTRSLRARVQKKKCKEELTREEKITDIESAECAIIRAVQTSVFKEELDVLKQIKRKNPDPNSRVFGQQRKTNIKTFTAHCTRSILLLMTKKFCESVTISEVQVCQMTLSFPSYYQEIATLPRSLSGTFTNAQVTKTRP